MKQNTSQQQNKNEEGCEGTACLSCRNCKAIKEERRPEVKNNFAQLYGKEAEHYFFYYTINIKQA